MWFYQLNPRLRSSKVRRAQRPGSKVQKSLKKVRLFWNIWDGRERIVSLLMTLIEDLIVKTTYGVTQNDKTEKNP
jgi:hypothetical protein